MASPIGSEHVSLRPATTPESRRISVVFSFRNEAAVLPTLIERVGEVLRTQPFEYELIFVNDDSTDDSLPILERAAATDSRVKVVNMSRRFGVGECILAGLAYASGDAIIYMDADLQDPPELIPQMIQKWRDGTDVVFTVRAHRHGESRLKMALTQLAYQAITLFSEIELPVNAGDFRLISRRARDELLRLRESEPYVRGLVRWIGFRQEPVFYERAGREAGQSHFPLLTNLGPVKTFVSGLTSFSTAPLYLVLIVGLIATITATMALIALCMFLAVGTISSTTFLVVGALFLWGSLLAAIGITGIYVGRIFKDVRGRPRYIVKGTIGLPQEIRRSEERA